MMPVFDEDCKLVNFCDVICLLIYKKKHIKLTFMSQKTVDIHWTALVWLYRDSKFEGNLFLQAKIFLVYSLEL